MTIDQALGILRPEPKTLDGLKKAYKAFMLQYHPDRNPNGLELCELGNAANDFLIKTANVWTQAEYKPDQETDPEYNIAEEINEIYKQIDHLIGLKITLSGVWLWVTGDTYTHKDALKKLGFQWASKKKAWSWKPEGQKRRFSKKEWGFDEIFGKYGRVDMEVKSIIQVRAA